MMRVSTCDIREWKKLTSVSIVYIDDVDHVHDVDQTLFDVSRVMLTVSKDFTVNGGVDEYLLRLSYIHETKQNLMFFC